MANKQNADTTKLTHEEISKLNLQGSKRPPGQSPGGVLHQQGGVTLKNAGRYPVALASILVAVGVGSFYYFRSTHPSRDGQAGSHSPAVQRAEELTNK